MAQKAAQQPLQFGVDLCLHHRLGDGEFMAIDELLQAFRQRGYLFHDRLLRPALVKVNTASESDAVDGDRAQDAGPNTMES